jgi:hypothetical protein
MMPHEINDAMRCYPHLVETLAYHAAVIPQPAVQLGDRRDRDLSGCHFHPLCVIDYAEK